MAVRAVRGATQLDVDERDHMLERVAEMVTQVMDANGWVLDDFISIIFTATTDLVSEFPAYAARMLGFTDVPLICTRELEIEGSMPRVVRSRRVPRSNWRWSTRTTAAAGARWWTRRGTTGRSGATSRPEPALAPHVTPCYVF